MQGINGGEEIGFYADPDNYFAIAFLPNHPCGDFINDFDYINQYGRPMPGMRARKILLELDEI
ncbi:MAG: hypothetical protein U9Q97_04095 [Acidobacteriota bacterium]|nr:hypothetical protein [Acidobacteriota bacterium]